MRNGHRPVVIVVDDDKSVRDSLQFLLDVSGYKVVTFASAQDYLDHVDGQPATLLLLDQHMPKTTGLELLAMLRHRGVRLPTALVTGSLSPAIVRQAKSLGAAVLEKPLACDALLRFVAGAASGRQA